jgi:hypothetical protein
MDMREDTFALELLQIVNGVFLAWTEHPARLCQRAAELNVDSVTKP